MDESESWILIETEMLLRWIRSTPSDLTYQIWIVCSADEIWIVICSQADLDRQKSNSSPSFCQRQIRTGLAAAHRPTLDCQSWIEWKFVAPRRSACRILELIGGGVTLIRPEQGRWGQNRGCRKKHFDSGNPRGESVAEVWTRVVRGERKGGRAG